MMIRLVPLLALCCALVACDAAGDTDTADGGIDSMPLAPGSDPGAAGSDTTAAVDTAGPVVTHVATIETDSGNVEIELFGKDAPKTVENFVGLAKKGFYKGILFHRVIPGFVAQAGDPTSKDSTRRASWGQSGESIFGAKFDDELDPSKPSAKLGYAQGMVAMANSGPNTNSSQFFIVIGDAAAQQLQYLYTIFGRVRGSNDAIRRIESTGMTGEIPLVPARIIDVKVTENATGA